LSSGGGRKGRGKSVGRERSEYIVYSARGKLGEQTGNLQKIKREGMNHRRGESIEKVGKKTLGELL